METASAAEVTNDSLKSSKLRGVRTTARFASETASSTKKRADAATVAKQTTSGSRSSLAKSTQLVNATPIKSRSGTDNVGDKKLENESSAAVKKSGLETRPESSPSSISSKPKTPPVSDSSKVADLVKKPSLKVSPTLTPKTPPSLGDGSSNGRSGVKRVPSNASSLPSPRSVTSSLRKVGSMTSSMDKGSVSSRRRCSTPDGRDARLMMLPQVDFKTSDELRLDLRGHRVRSLKAIKLSSNLEFVYLRDNLLSSLEGIEVLKRVKVLDLSFNDFKLPGFEPLGNCKVVQQLYLAGNNIASLASLPELPNLEFLSVAQNRLKSLSMAGQPRLQVLAASKNKISTLKGFPHLPALEHLRIEENPVLETPHIEAASILLVGPTLKKFNDQDLTPREVEVAKLYPAHTALCIRDGWEFCSFELAADSTFSFLVEQWKDQLPPGYMVNKASIDDPFEEDPCRCHFSFINSASEYTLDLKYQWFRGDKTPANFVPIADAMSEVYWPKNEDIGRCLKVECTLILNDSEFAPIFAISSPVSRGTGQPKVVNLNVHGELVEGNVIKGFAEVAWCGGTSGKGVSSWLRRRWNGSPVVIVGAEEDEYQLTVDDINSSLVFMYTPVTKEGAKGEPQYAITDFVKAAAPSVSNVHTLGDVVEGNTIRGKATYFGGREGQSVFQWFREKENGELLLVLSGTPEYTLSKDDVGWRLKFLYIPINVEGQEGESGCVTTDIVKKAAPKVINLKIDGDTREGSKVIARATVTGGTEGSSRVQWFKTSSSQFEGERGLEALSTSKISKTFRVPLGAVGYYILAKFTPMSPDGESGESAYVVSDKVVQTLPPSLNFLTVTGEFSEGQMLTASYGYIGGHEGNSLYSWYIHETENDNGAQILEASGVLQYCITKGAVGKFISFKCSPIRDDGVVGEPRIFKGKERVNPGSPRLLSLELTGKAIEGTTLVVNKRYWGGEEGDSLFSWLLTTSDGTQNEIKGATTSSYTLTCDDIGYHVSVSCEPVRSDGARGSVVVSEKIGPVIPGLPTCQSLKLLGPMVEGGRLNFDAAYSGGFKGRCTHEWFRVHIDGSRDKLTADESLDLTLDVVGGCIELVFTPIRQDGLKGSSKSIISDTIMSADPKGVELLLADCIEDQEIAPLKTYYGGKEGIGKYVWYRSKEKLDTSQLDQITSCEVVGETLTYKPSLEDIGSYLVLYWVPTRDDGRSGDPIAAISDDPVMAALPDVSEVHLRETSQSVYTGGGVYYGGHEGSSLYRWFRESNEGARLPIIGANAITYEVADLDYSCCLLFGYTPVRSDGVVGEERLSEPSDVIFPELPIIEMLYFKGNPIEGEILTAVEKIPNNEIQKNVWGNYKEEMKYQWSGSVGKGGSESFEPLIGLCSRSYKVRFEDIGRCLKCECIVTDVFGRSSEPTSTVTAPILPGMPKIEKLEIEGRGFHTNLYAVRGIYTGGKEGKSRIQWLRSMTGSPDLISIPGEVGRMYEANVDDVGYRLVGLYIPIREDGVEGQPISASTEPIAVEPDIFREVKQKLDLGSVKFEVLCDKDRSPKKAQVMGHLERRILEVNRKRIKVVKPGSKTSFPTTEVRGTYAPPFHVELYRYDQHRFKIVLDNENEVDLMVQTRHMRDVIILVIRGLAQKFNSTSLNSLLNVES